MQMSGDQFYIVFFQNIFLQCNILVIEFSFLSGKFHVIDIIMMDDEKILLALDF
jgi:hypothetical protein